MLARFTVHSPCRAPADVGLRHRVDATLMERVTAGDATDRKPPATPRTETLNRLVAVVRAGGLVTAGAHHPEERPDGHLVHPDEYQAGASHVRVPWRPDRAAADVSAADRALRRLVNGISVARPGRLTTMSSPGCSTRIGAIAARSRLRARFRLTASLAPGTAKATRETGDSPGRARIRTAPERASLPDSRTAAIRRRPGRRCRGFIAWEPESGACGPSDGVP